MRNHKIENILKRWKFESNHQKPIHYGYHFGTLMICSSEVGKLIGKMGSLAYKYKEILKAELPDFEDVKFWEISPHWI
jgi:hypothetical protein